MGVKTHIGRGFNLHWPWHDALSFIADPLSPPLYTAETLHMTGSCHMQPEPLTNIQINKWYDHRRSSLKNHQCRHKQSITFLKISCHIFFRRRRDCFFFFFSGVCFLLRELNAHTPQQPVQAARQVAIVGCTVDPIVFTVNCIIMMYAVHI